MEKNPNKNWSLVICLILAMIILAVFFQVHSFGFINLDDPGYVSENSNIQAGITLNAVKWAFTAGRAGNWHPLTWLSHMLDWQLYGSNAGGHHITNLIFHIANTLLLFFVLKRMTDAIWQSVFVAALFAIHPMHVESVAWIAERKDMLSTFFWLLTMASYLRYAKKPNVARYLLTLLALALGLMAKPMLVTLPFVLLLLDYWPLNRIPSGQIISRTNKQRKKITDIRYNRWIFYRLILEKVPFFALSLISSVITFLVQKSSQAVVPLDVIPLRFRVSNALVSYVKYIEKMFWPGRLEVFYPHQGTNVSIFYAVMSAGFLLVVTILVLRFAKKHRYLAVGWFWYLVTLVPVIGFVQVGAQAMADRYSYITLTGLFIIIAWGVPELLEKWRPYKFVLWISSLIILFTLTVCSYLQTRYWKDTITLGRHALKVTADNNKVLFMMADMYLKQDRLDEAIQYYAAALRINPDYVEAINGMGVALSKSGKMEQAAACYQKILEMQPKNEVARINLGATLASCGKYEEAVEQYKIVLTSQDVPSIRNRLGMAMMDMGRFQQAAAEFSKVLSADPNDPNVINNLGFAMSHSGKFDEAISLYNKALKIAPNSVSIRLNLGAALAGSGKLDEAAKEYEKTLLIQPQNAAAHNDLGAVLFRQGNLDQAIAHFSQAHQIDPKNKDTEKNLNIALAEKQKSRDKKADSTGK